MALSKMQRQNIIDSLIREIGHDLFTGTFSVDEFSKSHMLSKQSVYRYLTTLEAESKIIKQKNGKNNKYMLFCTGYEFKFPLENLSEDVVWNRNIKPLLLDLPELALKNCNYVFCEMLNNAIDHSEGTEVDILVLIDSFKVVFAITDDGIGIFNKIASALQLEEKRFAILELAKGKFTTEPESHTGEGIFFSAKACDAFAIFSDDLAFTSLSFREADQLRDFKLSVNLMRLPKSSTVVCFSLFREHSISLSEVFDQYAQDPEEYGFTKTIVPVKLLEYGDPSPTFISRSQAKRLLVRFERFEIIELDFTGIDEIGQGFADEVFRVFRNRHPNSRIIATNCNSHVKKMINHVAGPDYA